MTVWEGLYKLILGPIELLFDIVFALSMSMTSSPVLSIVVLSLAINLLVLPLYKKADALQREEQEISRRLKPRIDQIKEAFTGDERFMMLQTYYRQNHYKPYYALRGSLSLLLQIPFFMAAYNFLSNLEALRGVSFGPIADLAAPDAMLTLGDVTVNVLPILMTVINIVSGILYTRGQPLKSKIQLYGMALVFLVLLYNSPAGLVFYWTLNNLFSLGKNVLNLFRNPKKILRIGASAAGAGVAVFALLNAESFGSRRVLYFLILALLLQLPVLLHLIRRRGKKPAENTVPPGAAKHHRPVFFVSCVLLTVLTGVLIPSALIQDSPAEFVEMAAFRSPLIYVLHAFLLAAGTFLIWCPVFYLLSEEKRKPLFALGFAFVSLAAVVNYMFFGAGYGNISSRLVYDTDVRETVAASDILLNAGVLCCLAVAVFFLWRKKTVVLRAACILVSLVIGGMSLVNLFSVGGRMPEIQRLAEQQKARDKEIIHLDKNGKNVIVLMLDRAVGYFYPYIFEEKPELQEQFAGFTCYLNTISYGKGTHSGSPALFGGYEYTPVRLRERTDMSILEKQNAALRMMPLVFLENGYDVTVCDPPLANYSIVPDLIIFEDVPEIHTYLTEGAYEGSSGDDSAVSIADRNRVRERNFFCYSLFRAAPVLIQPTLYDSGNYNKTDRKLRDFISYDKYQIIKSLPDMTQVAAEGGNTFLMMASNLTHEPQILQEPEYEPSDSVDNTAYDLAHPSRFSAEGDEMVLETEKQKSHYHVNMAAMILLGKWFDFLREEGVYDNTRIILVADHGVSLGYTEMWSEQMPQDTNAFYPLLMVKDFNSRDAFSFSNDFMTNADTPTLAFDGLIENPVDPATGVAVTDQDKQNPEQIVCNVSVPNDFNPADNTFFTDPEIEYFALKNQDRLHLDNWSEVK